MKKNVLFMLVFLFTTYANSQSNFLDCATPDNNDPDPPGVYSYSTDPTVFENGSVLVLGIFFWQVKGPNGDYGNAVFTEDKLLEAVANLNIEYNQFNIFFKYRGYDSFDSPADLPLEIYENGVCVTYPGFDPDGFGKLEVPVRDYKRLLNAVITLKHLHNWAETDNKKAYIETSRR